MQLSFDKFYQFGKMNNSEPDLTTNVTWLSINPIHELVKAGCVRF